MPEDKNCKQLQPPKTMDDKKKKKKKKKKRKKTTASNTPPEDAEKPHTASLPPETSPVSLLSPVCPPRGRPPRLKATSRRDGERLGSSGQRSKKPTKGSPSLQTATNSADQVEGYEAELGAQTRESVRWEGVLEDPQAEEKRLELYRANRRQRYRETLLKETHDALRQTFRNEKREGKAQCESDQQDTESLLRLSKDWVKKEGKTEPFYFKMQVIRS